MKHPFVAGPVWPPLTRLAPAPALPLRPCSVKGALPKGAAEEEPVGAGGARGPRACAPVPDGRWRAQQRRVPARRRAALGTVGQGWPLGGPVKDPCKLRGRLAGLPGSVGCLLGSPARTSFDVSGTQEVGLQRENLSDHLPGRGPSHARDGQLEERLTWVCPVPQNHLWSLFKGGKDAHI